MAEWDGDEQELVRRCREGSEAAYAALVRQHRPRLFTLAYRLTSDRSTAEDVVQETFLAAFRGLDKFEPKPSLSAWLNTICVRMAGRAASKRAAAPKTSLDANPPGATSSAAGGGDGRWSLHESLVELDPAADPSLAAETAELRRELTDAIARLPFKYRVPVVLRHVMGLDYGDAAVAMDVPLNTFKSQLLRGTRLLRNDLSNRLDLEPTSTTPGRDGQGDPAVDVARGAVSPEAAIH